MRTTYAVIAPTNLHDNGYVTDMTDYRVSSPFARWAFRTNAQKINIKTWCNIFSSFSQWAHIGVVCNGAHHTTLVCTANGSNVFVDIDLPAGTKTVELIAGLQSKPSSLLGTFLKSVYLSGGGLVEPIPPPVQPDRVLFYGDSISVGANATYPTRYGYVTLLRERGYSVMLEGWGWRQLHDDGANASARTAFANLMASYQPKTIWLAIGTNDFALGAWSAVDFSVAYADQLDKLHAVLPNAVIVCQSPLLRGDEVTQNLYGDIPDDYRSGIQTAALARTGYCLFADGKTILTYPAHYADSVHPNDLGFGVYAAYIAQRLS